MKERDYLIGRYTGVGQTCFTENDTSLWTAFMFLVTETSGGLLCAL